MMGSVTMAAAGSAATVTNSGTPQAAILNFTIPQVSPGTASAERTVFVSSLHQDPSNTTASQFVPLNATGDPTGRGQHPLFSENATLMPVSCNNLTLFAFQNPQSGGDVTVTLFKSDGGTGTPASTGLSVTAADGAGSHAELSYATAAGDLLSYQISGANVAANGVKLSVSLVCH